MRNWLLFVAVTSVFNFLIAQSKDFKKEMAVSHADLMMESYLQDSTANALVLYEHGESYFDKNSFKLITKISKKIKIINRNGFEHATVTEPLYRDRPNEERITDIEGTTFNLVNGNIERTELSEASIIEENYNEKVNLVKFTFPNLRENSVITYSYTRISPFIRTYYPWEFQGVIPKLHSEYHTEIIANYDYNIKLVGTQEFHHTDQKLERNCIEAGNGGYADCTKSVYIMKDIPAFVPEDYMTTKENYLSRIDFELKTFKSFDGSIKNFTKTWKITDTEIKSDTDLGRDLRKGGVVKDLLPQNIKTITNPIEKAEKIYRFVQENYSENDKKDMFYNISVRDLIKNKSGTSSEINILLHNLLDEEGIDVQPLLCSTREHGLPTKLFPVILEFNYLLIKATLNNKSYLLDASNPYLDFGEIPFKTLNQYGRLLDFKGESQWLEINPTIPSLIQQRADLLFKDDGSITGLLKSRSSGYHSLNKRKDYFNNSKGYVEYYKNNYSNPEIIDHRLIEGEKNSFKFEEEFDITYTPDKIDYKYFINPFVFKFFKDNPFKLQKRSYPIDFGYKDSYMYSATLAYPPEYEVENLPEDFSLTLPENAGSLVFSVQQKDYEIELLLRFDFKLAIYHPNYYPFLKTFMAKIIDTQKNSVIVLKKK